MRAARALHMLLLLQNRGRMTSGQLAEELEVTPRTVLRDVDALTEAGLPVIVYQGNQGGIELGFGYRTRLTGLAADEAEALAVILGQPAPGLAALGMEKAGRSARSKLIEALPDAVRDKVATAQARFAFEGEPVASDARLPALAQAIRDQRIVWIRTRTPEPVEVHPSGLTATPEGWYLRDDRGGDDIPLSDCSDINISNKRFGTERRS